MRDGKWTQPRHPNREVFELDYPKIDLAELSVACPGCKQVVVVSRRSPLDRIAGWCKKCNRGVCP